MQPVSRDTQTAYKWGVGGVGGSLFDIDGLLAIEKTLAPNRTEMRDHHNKDTQCFYLREGTAVMKIDGHNAVLAQGMALHIQSGADHAIADNSSIDIQLLVIWAPSTRSDRQESTVKK